MSAAGTAGATGATCEAGSAGLRQDHLSESKFLVFQYFNLRHNSVKDCKGCWQLKTNICEIKLK